MHIYIVHSYVLIFQMKEYFNASTFPYALLYHYDITRLSRLA
jgi:hypothetical protein